MTTRLALAGGLVIVAAVVAVLVGRRRPSGPAVRDQFAVPAQLRRADFRRPDAPWLVVVFTSVTCASCRDVAATVAGSESDTTATCEVEWTAARALHERYGVEAVPLTVVADADGVVRASFEGPVAARQLEAALAALRTRRPEGPPAAASGG